MKPSYGLISLKGVLPLARSMDHVGPMAIRVEDLVLAMGLIGGRGPHAGDGFERVLAAQNMEDRLQGVVIGVPAAFFYEGLREDLKAKVLDAVRAMESLGARVEEIEIPGVVEADRAAYTVLFAEAAACLEVHGRTRPQDLGETVMANLRVGLTIPAAGYIRALRVRGKVRQELKKVFSQVDILAVPGTMVDAHPLDAGEVTVGRGASVDVRTALTRYTRYFNFSGNPVLNIPCGLSDRGLPVGMQLVGRRFAEARLLAAGYIYPEGLSAESTVTRAKMSRARLMGAAPRVLYFRQPDWREQ